MWQVVTSKIFQKQLKKLDRQVAVHVLEDMDCLKDNPLQSSVHDDSRARKLGLRYIKVAHDWRLFFRMKDQQVLVEFVFHRESAYKEVARYLCSIKM